MFLSEIPKDYIFGVRQYYPQCAKHQMYQNYNVQVDTEVDTKVDTKY